MNREIKFRAWIENRMVYLKPAGLQYYDFEGSYALSFAVDGYSSFWAHECYEKKSKEISKSPIMQFTGKKDRDGKEIYDGDIFEFDESEWGGKENIHVCSWDEVNAEWSWGGGCTSDMGFRKVVGNIYENPELL